MAGHGLSSQEAQEKLQRQLEHLCHRLGRVNWLREIRQPPYTLLVCLGLALAGLLLVIDFSLSPEQNGSTLLHALILISFSYVNCALFCWEVYIIKTRKIRRLLSKVRPFLDTVCPWTAASYPSRSINTLRGHFTVHAHRDGRLVNLPCSLVVQGDVIELYRDIPSPANATYLNSKGIATNVHVERGNFPPTELFQDYDGERGDGVRIVGEEKRATFVVMQTPIIATFRNTLQKKRATSVLSRQKTHTLLANNVLILVTLGVSLVWNVIRFSVLPDDFGHWTEMILQLQVYTVLALLQPVLPLMWAFVNLYGTAKIVLLAEKDPESSPIGHSNTIFMRFRNVGKVLKKMVVLLVCPSMYPNYRVFHILGSLTSLCSIDKEYVLTDSVPVPEKVFFLTRRSLEDVLPKDTGQPSTDGKIFRISTEDGAEAKGKGEENLSHRNRCSKCLGKLETCVEVHVETVSVDGAHEGRIEGSSIPTCKSTQELEKAVKPLPTEMSRAGSDSAILSSTSPRNASTAIAEAVPLANEADKPPPNPKKMPSRFLSQDSATLSERSGLQVSRVPVHEDASQTNRFSQALSSSAMSLASHFELVGEILDLSPDLVNQSGLGFDDLNWESFLGSLKPIGISCLATSHCLRDPYSWSPGHCSEYVRSNMSKTSCVCSLGVQIGVNQYLTSNFTKVGLLFGVSDVSKSEEKIATLGRKPPATLLTENFIQPHLLSSVLTDKTSGNYLIMSRGSGDMVAACCSDFWDGKDLQPMTNIERGEIEVFFRRRHLTSYCVTLAYNPLVDFDLSSLLEKNIGLHIPKDRIQADNYPNTPVFGEGASSTAVAGFSGEQLFSNLVCNQVFLGVVSLQFQPKADIVHLIEDLESTGIRFVYFTNENELRGKVFAEKLGLEAGWNCHISLTPGSEDEQVSPDSNDEQELDSQSSSTSSSLNSVINAFQSYIRAKLPKGIRNIRPHLNNVDNVPLLVPLFTDCTVDAIREMIEIMQENGEVVMCLGNAWNPDNLSIFAQADVSLSIIPESASLHCCQDPESNKDGTLSTSVSDNNFGNPPQTQTNPRFPLWPTPLEMASYLNTALCQLCVHRQGNVRILDSVTQSRHIVNSIRHGLLFGLGETLSISILMLAATILFLPPPFSGGHIFMFLLFSIPLVSLSFLSSTFDPAIKTQMPSRKRKVLNEKLLGIVHFCCTFLPSVLVSLVLFGLTLSTLCSSVPESMSDCHPLLGNRNESSLWNGWRGVNEQGLSLAQDVTALLFSLHLVAHSIRFIHRTDPLWRLYRHISWPYIASVSLAVFLQIVYTIVSQTLAYKSSTTYDMSVVPAYVWVVGILWCVPLVIAHELLKYRDRKLVVKLQRHLKLEFETKLGMNSPF